MKLTPMLGGAYSGSFGGLTASHNKGGQYLRRRSVPTNPNTSRQSLVRGLAAALMVDWSQTLTEPQRQSWRDYAANVTVTDKLGQPMFLSGVNWYVGINVARLQAAMTSFLTIPQLNDAPVVFNLGSAIPMLTEFSGVFTTPPGTATIAGDFVAPLPLDGHVLVFVGPPQTPGRNFYKGPYQLAHVEAVSATDTTFSLAAIDLSLSTDWSSATVPVAAWDGLRVPLRLKCTLTDGRTSSPLDVLYPFTDATP